MPKLISKKSAESIAALYNQIYVAELMMKKATLDSDQDSYNLWSEHGINAVNSLKELFGIKVVGY